MGATTRYYFGAYEKDIDRFGNATQTDYIYTPAGLTAMMKGGTLYYIHTDNLGSIQAITDESKNTISSYYYTPWGARVLLSGVNITDRGYTFHEHLTEFGLINMNGRVYDPMLARFLSPDPYVQMPDYTQNFNRYSYCLNNPFKYTDPSGESIIAIIGGAIIGGIGYTASVAFSDYGLCAWSSNDCVKSMAVGAISGAVTCGIGSVFGTTGSIVQGTFDLGNELARAGAHALANGFISVATGNEFMPGFVAGGMGSFGGSLFQGMAGEIMQAHPILEAIGTVGSSALSGGVGAELTGGDFWRGAATGAIVGAFNHVGDKGDNLLHNKMKKYKNYGDVDGLNIEYGAYKDANDWTGVEISIEYTGADFSGSHWEQYIETNYPASRIRDRAYKGHNVKYWDDEYTGNRHYYTDKQMEKHILNGGRTVTFRDIPSRPPADGSTYWKGNLYLIRDNKAILKLYYSYTSNNNKITFTPILIGH